MTASSRPQHTPVRPSLLYLWLRHLDRRTERGDVPGWVLITVMSAGVVAILLGIASRELPAMFQTALNSVK